MITTIDRFFLREIARTLGVIVLVLGMAMLAVLLMQLLGKAAAGVLGQEVLMQLLGLELLKTLGLLLPPAYFFAVLWVLAQAHQQGEMIALEAAGHSPWRLHRAVLLSALPLALLVAWLVFEVLPWSKSHALALIADSQGAGQLSALQPERFHSFQHGRLVVYTQGSTADGSGLAGVFVRHTFGPRPVLITAREAHLRTLPGTTARYVVLRDGQYVEGEAGDAAVSRGRFREYALLLDDLAVGPVRKLSALPTAELLASGDPKLLAELHYRLSLPLAVLALAVVGIPLARSRPRQPMSGRIVLAVIIYALFMTLQKMGERWLEHGVLPTWLGLWWLPLGLLLLGLLLLARDAAWRLRRRRPDTCNAVERPAGAAGGAP